VVFVVASEFLVMCFSLLNDEVNEICMKLNDRFIYC